jgi:hypothetical protein
MKPHRNPSKYELNTKANEISIKKEAHHGKYKMENRIMIDAKSLISVTKKFKLKSQQL